MNRKKAALGPPFSCPMASSTDGDGMATRLNSPLETAAEYLESLIDVERMGDRSRARLDLAPVRELLSRVGDPQAGLSVVHVAGSKGKGSTCFLAEGILAEAGERVGTFTSPHLTSWVERFRIDGRPVEGSELAEVVEILRPHVDEMRSAVGPVPTFFDATTAAALLLFERASVDRVLLEVGLGGRLDSTNIVHPDVACISTIELEHTDILGDRIESIAFEKSGIVKPGIPCVVGPLPGPARDVVRERANEVGAPLREFGVDFEIDIQSEPPPVATGPVPRAFRYRERGGFEVDARLNVLGDHQAVNASLAIAAVRCLGGYSDDSLERAVREGLPRVELPGRVEIIAREPWVLVDEAHTVASTEALVKLLPAFEASECHLVLSISRDKKLGAILRSLLPSFDRVIVTRSEKHRSMDPVKLAAEIRQRGHVDVEVCPDPRRAVQQARKGVGRRGLLCAAGSIYLAGIAREEFRRHAP